jgi:hypothetical protein
MAQAKLSELELKLKKISKAAKEYADGIGQTSSVKLFEKSTPNVGYLKTYILAFGITQYSEITAQNTIGEIDIPKDFLVKSGAVQVVATADTPYTGAVAGDKYLDFVVNTKDSVSGTETDSHIYIPVKDLVDIYTGSNAIDVSNTNVISLIINQTASGLVIDANGLSINLDPTSSNGLALTSNGLKLALVTASTNGVGGTAGAMSAADKEKLDKLGIDLLTDAEIGSWFGYAANSTVVTTTLPAVSDDSITAQ